jgi:hypothetical protein
MPARTGVSGIGRAGYTDRHDTALPREPEAIRADEQDAMSTQARE